MRVDPWGLFPVKRLPLDGDIIEFSTCFTLCGSLVEARLGGKSVAFSVSIERLQLKQNGEFCTSHHNLSAVKTFEIVGNKLLLVSLCHRFQIQKVHVSCLWSEPTFHEFFCVPTVIAECLRKFHVLVKQLWKFPFSLSFLRNQPPLGRQSKYIPTSLFVWIV